MLLGSPDPDLMPAAFLTSSLAGGGLENEGEGAVLVHGDHGGDDLADLVLGGGVVLLAEAHDVNAGRTESRAYGGGGIGFAGGKGDLNDAGDLAGHARHGTGRGGSRLEDTRGRRRGGVRRRGE